MFGQPGQLAAALAGLGGGAYTMTATFSNALNLPTKAKVKLNGADVGEVESMAARTTPRWCPCASGPACGFGGEHAELRTATPMGDVFVAVIPPPSAGPDSPDLGATVRTFRYVDLGGDDYRGSAGPGLAAGERRSDRERDQSRQLPR